MVLGKIARFMSEESRTWVWGYLGCFREGLQVLVKHSIKTFWEGVLKFFWNY